MENQINILFLEDSPADAELVTRELKKFNLPYQVNWVKSKPEFLEALKNGHIDIVFCDYKLPGFNALEALEILRATYPDIPLIIVSGTIGEELAIEAMKLGAADYVMKDRLGRLVPSLRRALDEKRIASECKEAEARLRYSEEKFSRIFRLSPDALLVSRIDDGVLIEVNDGTVKQFGYTVKELIGSSPLSDGLGLWSDDRERQAVVRELERTGEVNGFEAVFRRKGGSVFVALLSCRIIEIGGKRCMLSLVHDITERKMFLHELSKNQERYRLVFENMTNGFALHEIVLDDSGQPIDYVFLEVNPAFERMLGLNREQIIGRKVTEIISGIQDDPADWIGKYGKIAMGVGDLKFENFSKSLDRWFSVNAFSPKRGQFVTIFEDITERKNIDMALRDAEMRYHMLFELSPEGIVIIDPSTTRFLEFNETAHLQLGYSREEFSRLKISDLEIIETPKQIHERVNKVVGGERQDFETQHHCRNGEIKYIYVTAQMVEILGHAVYYCIWRDISEQKKNKELESKRAKELEVFYKASIGREERIIELKKEVARLQQALKEQAKNSPL